MRKSAAFIVLLTAVISLQGCDYIPDYLKAIFQESDIIVDKLYEKGSFKGPLKVSFASLTSGDGHPVELIQLIAPFGYKDYKGVDWDVPRGEISDGASIPWPLWAIVGGPYSGPYRQAAVVHDYYCFTKERPWEDVHLMFLEAALKAGTNVTLAKFMYAAILADGPRWPSPKPREKASLVEMNMIKAQATATPSPEAEPKPVSCSDLVLSVKTKTDEQRFADLKAWIEHEKPTLKHIQNCVAELRKARRAPTPK